MVKYFKEHSNTDIERGLDFGIINLSYVALVKLFAYLEDTKMDKSFALKRFQSQQQQSHITLVLAATYSPQLTFVKPTTS